MKNPILLCCLAGSLLLPAVLSAQDEPRPGPRPGGDRPNLERMREELRNLPPEEREARIREMRERFGRGEGAPVAGIMAARAGGSIERVFMVLTPEQRESLRKAGEENREQVRALEEKLRAARQAIVEVGVGPDFNEAALREKLEAAAKLETELTVLRARALAKVDPPLSAEQLEKIKNPPPLLQRPAQAPGEFRDRPQRDPNRPSPRPPGGPRDENGLPPRSQP